MEVKGEHLAKLLLSYEGTTLVCTEDNHYKFWNIVHNESDNTLVTTWGRIGQKAQSSTKKVTDSYMPIKWQIENQINKKIKKGYEYIV